MNVTKKVYDYITPSQILVAQHDYDTSTTGDLSFQKEEKFECLEAYTSWLLVRNCKTGENGFVPREYLAPESTSKNKENCEWYHENISRVEAELLLQDHIPGTFLVRITNLKHAFSLSIKTTSTVGHYKIFKKWGSYFLSKNIKDKSLINLINFYRNNDSLGLVQKLLYPCPKPKPKIYDFSGKYRKNFEIDREELTILDILSSGNFGVVSKGQWRNQTIAIKQLRTFDSKIFQKEIEPLKLLQHENVVTLYGVCTKEEPYLMLFQYADRGSLEKYLKSAPFVTTNIRLRFIQNINSGMVYVSQKNIVHRDLAARNILVTKNCKAIIADFGLSRVTKDGQYDASRPETAYRWQAVECFQNHFSTKSDVWAFGVLIVEIFTGCDVPYSSLKNSTEVLKYLQDGKRLDRPTEMSDDIYKKIKTCWKYKPKDRPSFSILKDFFYEYE